jgi:hypothetical protein
MTGDISGVRTRQRKLHLLPYRADGPSLSIDYSNSRYSESSRKVNDFIQALNLTTLITEHRNWFMNRFIPHLLLIIKITVL